MRNSSFIQPIFAVAFWLAATSAFADGIKGTVTFDGKAPKLRAVPMTADPKCQEQHPKGMGFSPIEVGAKGGLSNVFVYVKKGLEGKTFQFPKDAKLVLDQRGCWYTPRVSGVMAGQPVEILNSDPTMHNVNAHGEFNKAMPAGVTKIDTEFKKPQVMLEIKCNVHPWMTTYVGVLDHPYYAVTSKDGAFEIKGLPPGKYTIEAWHESLGTVTKDVTVGAKETSLHLKFQNKKGQS